MKKLAILALMFVIGAIFASQADAKRSRSQGGAADLNAAKKVVFTWKEGKGDAAVKLIAAAGMKVVHRFEVLPIGIATGKLTDESLRKLLSNGAIVSIEPDVKLQVD